eukprot:386458_1
MKDIDKHLTFTDCHHFDGDFSRFESRKRRKLLWPIFAAIGAVIARVVVKSAVDIAFFELARSGCYYDLSTAYELNKGLMHLKDLSIGDHVFDGNDFTKIYFIQHYDEMYLTNMYQIKYG